MSEEKVNDNIDGDPMSPYYTNKLNPIDDGEYKQTTPERLEAFVHHLESKAIIVNVRKSRGKDIDAACGQLVNKNKSASQVFK